MTFLPPAHTGRYERRHVVLVGDTQLLHVIHTGPVGSLRSTAVEFEKVTVALSTKPERPETEIHNGYNDAVPLSGMFSWFAAV